MTYALPLYPVPPKLIAQYGRGRVYFPAPVEFRVPLLCCVSSVRLFYFVTKVSSQWEQWELAMPQATDNHVLCYSDPQDKGAVVRCSYVTWTVAQLRKKMPQFWRQSVVLTSDGTWLPMELADPFNLLGFTCFPAVQEAAVLPSWTDVGQKSSVLATSIVKPVYVPTPMFVTNMVAYEDPPLACNPVTQAPVVKSNFSLDISKAVLQSTSSVSWLQLCENASVETIRDYLHGCSQGPQRGLHVQSILDVYYENDMLLVYLCQFAEFPAQSFWVADSLLELLELHHGSAYDAFILARQQFHVFLRQRVDLFEASIK